jgi:ankyrin repeat protein
VGNKPVIYYAARSSHCIIRVIDVLVKHGADINARTISGFTALHGACEFGYSEVATYLLEHGADVNALDNGGDTPLHIAAASLDFDAERAVRLIRILIAHGAKIDARDNGGDTPADMAHKYGNEYLVVAIERAAKDKRSDPPR